jgi:ketosteroid isomerase-like protein
MRPRLASTFAVLAVAAMLVADPVHATQENDIGDTFARFLAAQNAHDLAAVGELLSDSPDFIWASPGTVVRGREAALGRFRELFRGTWRVDPHWLTFQILKLDVSTAEIFVRVLTTSSTPARRVRLNLVLVDTAHGWRVLSILASEWPPDGN